MREETPIDRVLAPPNGRVPWFIPAPDQRLGEKRPDETDDAFQRSLNLMRAASIVAWRRAPLLQLAYDRAHGLRQYPYLPYPPTRAEPLAVAGCSRHRL